MTSAVAIITPTPTPKRVAGPAVRMSESLRSLAAGGTAPSSPPLSSASLSFPFPTAAVSPPPHRNGGIPDKDVFPCKLHRTLTLIERDGLDSVLSWLPHGRALRVHSSEKFASDVVRPYFGMVKASSFTRQLNIYGFRRVISGRDKGAYWHPYFLRGHPQLTGMIRREPTKGTGVGRKKERPGEDPDFYSMPPPESEGRGQQAVCGGAPPPCRPLAPPPIHSGVDDEKKKRKKESKKSGGQRRRQQEQRAASTPEKTDEPACVTPTSSLSLLLAARRAQKKRQRPAKTVATTTAAPPERRALPALASQFLPVQVLAPALFFPEVAEPRPFFAGGGAHFNGASCEPRPFFAGSGLLQMQEQQCPTNLPLVQMSSSRVVVSPEAYHHDAAGAFNFDFIPEQRQQLPSGQQQQQQQRGHESPSSSIGTLDLCFEEEEGNEEEEQPPVPATLMEWLRESELFD